MTHYIRPNVNDLLHDYVIAIIVLAQADPILDLGSRKLTVILFQTWSV